MTILVNDMHCGRRMDICRTQTQLFPKNEVKGDLYIFSKIYKYRNHLFLAFFYYEQIFTSISSFSGHLVLTLHIEICRFPELGKVTVLNKRHGATEREREREHGDGQLKEGGRGVDRNRHRQKRD